MLAVIHASQLVTLAGPARPRVGAELAELQIIPDGALLVEDDKIVAVGTTNEIQKQIEDAEVIDARGKVVLPGFVDAHTHLVFGGNRLDDFERRARGETYEQIAQAGGGIWSTVEKTRAASESELLEVAKKRARWFLRNGTTTVEAKSGYGLTTEDELKILRVLRALRQSEPRGSQIHAIRDSRIALQTRMAEVPEGQAESALEIVPTFLGAHAIPGGTGAEEYVETVIEEMLPKVANEKLAEYCDVFCERGYFTVAQARKILVAGRGLGLKLRGHVDQLTNSGGAKLMAELQASTADHLEKTDEAGIAALSAAKVQPVLLPGSVYALGLRDYPRARAMIEAGLAIVLATDFNPGSSPTVSMPMILSLACTQMKMSPAEALTAATINAACSLGRGDRIGSLEKGKLANFAIFDCEDFREIAYWFGATLMCDVFVRGKRIEFPKS